jgi:putative FmdB family regulatory protein
MAMYEYLCCKCRNQFELMRPMSEAEKPARCPKCSSEAQKLMSGFSSEAGDSTQLSGEPFSKRTVVKEGGSESPHRNTRHMAHESLLQQLEELAGKIRILERARGEAATRMEALEREKGEAVARAQTLQREVSGMAALITLAGEKVDEILKIGATDDVSQPPAVNAPATSTIREQLCEFSADTQREPKESSVRPWLSR